MTIRALKGGLGLVSIKEGRVQTEAPAEDGQEAEDCSTDSEMFPYLEKNCVHFPAEIYSSPEVSF